MLKWKSRNAGIIYFYLSRWRAKWQRRRIEEISYEARVEPIVMVMRRGRLQWFGNDKRRDGTERRPLSRKRHCSPERVWRL